MFCVNDVVMYGVNGICKIIEIAQKDFSGEEKTYYVLKPLYDDRASYYVPVDSRILTEKMHKVLSEQEISTLMKSFREEETLWISDEKQRKENYQKAIANGDRLDLLRMIKSLCHEKEERQKMGKNLHLADEKFLKDAMKLLRDEFHYTMKISEADFMQFLFGGPAK